MSNVKVAVRIRPPNSKEKEQHGRVVVHVQGDKIYVHDAKLESRHEQGDLRDRFRVFVFDHVYLSSDPSAHGCATQEKVFQDLGTEVLQAAFDGYNACVFAYGQTGSGKTHTMMGYEGDPGLIPRICEGLFGHIEDIRDTLEDTDDGRPTTYRIEVSYYEIYNEKVRDLLNFKHSVDEKKSLKVREHPKDGPYVQGLSQHQVKDNDRIQKLIDLGNSNRTTAATYMHDHSSRSHAIFTLTFIQAKLSEERPSETKSRINLVDLAGSERADPTSQYNKGRLKEGANINRSLVTLGNVIKALAEKSLFEWHLRRSTPQGSTQSLSAPERNGISSPQSSPKRRNMYIPYRDSVLTYLLRDSLGGNSKTIMIATIAPSHLFYNETIGTLRYAQRAKNIINKPFINEDPNVKLIRELKAEIVRLQNMLVSPSNERSLQRRDSTVSTVSCTDNKETQAGSLMSLNDSSSGIAERLEENEMRAQELTQSWITRWLNWQQTHEILKDSDMSIRPLSRRTSSTGVIVDSQLPHLVSMDDDVLSTGVVIYHLKEGNTYIGSDEATFEQDIILTGAGAKAEHCVIINSSEEEVTLHPNLGAQVLVNNQEVTGVSRLSQGDLIHLGQGNVFRFNNPQEAAKLREHRRSLHGDGKQPLGAISRASSMSSLGNSSQEGDSSPCPTPLSPLHRGYEIEQQCKTESEKVQHAKKELERVSLLRSQEAETQQDEEEDVWRQWEEHRQQIAAEQNLLADKENQLRKELQDALAELEAVRRQLSSEQGKFHSLMDEQVRRFLRTDSHELEWIPKEESQELGIQAMYDFAELVGEEKRLNGDLSDKDKLLGIADLYGAEIRSLRDSFEGQKRQLMHEELVQQLKAKDTLQGVDERQKNIEELFLVDSEKLEGERKVLEEKERRFQQRDSDKLQAINSQREKIERLEQRQRQLVMYIEEKEREKYLPDSVRVEPLGESCSEESLAATKGARYSQPTKASLGKKHARSTSDSTTFPKQRRYLSPVQAHNIQQSPDDRSGLQRPIKPAPRVISPKSKEKGLAKQVTDRLYAQTKTDGNKQKRKESSEGHSRSKSAPALKSDKRMVPVGMVPSAPRLRHSSSSLASVPESYDEAYQRTDHDTSIMDTTVDISYDESSRMYDSESLRFSESDSRTRARSASPSVSLAVMSGRSSATGQTQRSNVTSRGEGSGEEVLDDTRTTPEGLGEKLTEDHPAHIPYTEAELMKSDTFHHDDEAFDPAVYNYRRKEQSPSPMKTRQVSESPAGRGSSRGRGRAKERYIPEKVEKSQPRPGQNAKPTNSVMKETKSSRAKRTPSKEDAESPQLSRSSSKDSNHGPQLGRSSSRESIGSNKSSRSISRSSSVKSDRSASVASNKSERGTSRDAQLVHRDSGSSFDSSLSQASSSQSGTKAKVKDSSASDSKTSDKKVKRKSKSEKSSMGEKVLSKPKKKKGDVPVEIFIAGSFGGSGGTSLDMGDGEQPQSRTHNDPAHELFAKSLRGGSIEKEYRPFTEEVFSSSDGAKYIIRRRQNDNQLNGEEITREISPGSNKSDSVERMISDDSHHSIQEAMDSLDSPSVLSVSLPNWKLARSDAGVYSDDSLDERRSPEGRKQSPREAHSPAGTVNSRGHFSYDSLDDDNRSMSVGARSSAAPLSPRLEPVIDCEVLTSGEYQPSHMSVDSLMQPTEALGQTPVLQDSGRESPRVKASSKKREGSFKSRKNRQHQSPAAESDVVVNLSDDSLASSGEIKPTGSRPTSASKRRRKPRPSSATKRSKTHSSEEYATSDNDSVYSEDSLGNLDENKDDLLTKNLSQSAHQMASITENVEALTTALQDEYTPDSKGVPPEQQNPAAEPESNSNKKVKKQRKDAARVEPATSKAKTAPSKLSQKPAEDKYFTEDIVIELDSDPSETVDGSSDFGSVRLSYGRERTPGCMSPPTHDTMNVDETGTLMETSIDTSPPERLSSSSSSHSPASSTDSSPRHQDYLASSDQYSPYHDDADIQPSASLSSAPKNDRILLETGITDSEVPDVTRDYDPQLYTGLQDSKVTSSTDKLELTQLDTTNADYSSAIGKVNDAVQDRFSRSEELHVGGVERKKDRLVRGQHVDTEIPGGLSLDHKNDPMMDYDGMMSPHVMSDAAHVATEMRDTHAISERGHETNADKYGKVTGHESSMEVGVGVSAPAALKDILGLEPEDNMEVDQTYDKLDDFKGITMKDCNKQKDDGRTKSPQGQDENIPVLAGLSPRSDSLHESSESTVSNDTVVEALQDSSSSSPEAETDITDIDDEFKSTPTHASYSAGALTEEEVMPLPTRWSSSDSAIDVVEDSHPVSHTSESETQRDSGTHSADDMLDDDYKPIKMQSKVQYNQDSSINKSSVQEPSNTYTDILDNHKHDSVDPNLHELTQKVSDNKDVSNGSNLIGDLHSRDVLVYSATRQDDNVIPEIKLSSEAPEVINSKGEVVNPNIRVASKEDETDEVLEVVNLVPVNKDRPHANNRDSGYYSMPSESGLMSSSSVNEGDNSVNEVFTPQPTNGSPYPVFEGQDFPFSSTPQGKTNAAMANQDTQFFMEGVHGVHNVTFESEAVADNKYEKTGHLDMSVIDQTKDHQDKGLSDLGLNSPEKEINHGDINGGLSSPVNGISALSKEQPVLQERPTSRDMFTPDFLDQTNIDHSDPDLAETHQVPGAEPNDSCPKQLTQLQAEPQSSDTNTESQERDSLTEENKVQKSTGDSSKPKNEREDTMDSSNSDDWSLEDTVRENTADLQKGENATDSQKGVNTTDLQKEWSFEEESLKLDLADSGTGIGFSEYSTPRSDSTDVETTREVRSAIGQAIGQYALLHSMSIDSAASDDTLAAACDLEFNLDETLVTIEDADEDAADSDDPSNDSDVISTTLQPPKQSRPVLSPAASVSEEESLDVASDSDGDGEIMPFKNTLLDRLQVAKAADSDADSKHYDSDSFDSDSDDDNDNDAAKKLYKAAALAEDNELLIPEDTTATCITGDLNVSQRDNVDDPNHLHGDGNQSALSGLDLSPVMNANVALDNDNNTTSTEDTTLAPDELRDLCEGTQDVFNPRENTADALNGSGALSASLDRGSPSEKLQEMSLDEGYVTINNTSEFLDVSTMNDMSLTQDTSRATQPNRSLATEEIELADGSTTDDETSVDELHAPTTVEPLVSEQKTQSHSHISEPLHEHVEQHSTPPLSPATSETNMAEIGIEVTTEPIDTQDRQHSPNVSTQPLQDYEIHESQRPPTSGGSDAGEFTVVHFKAPEPETKKNTDADAVAGKLERAKELVQSQLLMLQAADVLHQQSQLLDQTYPTLADEEENAPMLELATGPDGRQLEMASANIVKRDENQINHEDYEEDFDSSESGLTSGSNSAVKTGKTSDHEASFLALPQNPNKTSGSSRESSIPEEIDADSAAATKSASEYVYEDDFDKLTKSSSARSVEESLVSSVDSSQQLSDDNNCNADVGALHPDTNVILREIERTKQITRICSESSLAVEVGDPDLVEIDDDLDTYEVANAIHSPAKDDSLQSENNGSLLSSADSKDVEDMIDPWNKVKSDHKRGQMHHQPSSLSMVAEMGDDQAEDVSVDVERMSDAEDEESHRVGFVISEPDVDAEPEDEVNISDYEGLEEAEVADGDDSERWTHISRKSEQSKKSSGSLVVHIGEQEDEEVVSGSEDEAAGAQGGVNAAHPPRVQIPPVNGHLLEDHADDHTSTTSGIASYDDFGRKTDSSFAGEFDAGHPNASAPPAMPNIPSISALNSRTSSIESAWSTTPAFGDPLENIDENSSVNTDADSTQQEDKQEDTDLPVMGDVNDIIDSVRKERNLMRHGFTEDSPKESPEHAQKETENIDIPAVEHQEEMVPIVVTATDKPEKLDTVLKKFLDELEMTKPTEKAVEASNETQMEYLDGRETSDADVRLEDVDQEITTEDSSKSSPERPPKPANFIDSKVTGFNVNPWDAVVRESPVQETETTQQVVVGSQETLNISAEKKEHHAAGFQVLGLQPERVRDVPHDHYVYAEEPSVPCMDHLKHSAINIEIRPWRMAEGEEYRPKSESLSSGASEFTDPGSDDSRAFVSSMDAQDIRSNLEQMLSTGGNDEGEYNNQEQMLNTGGNEEAEYADTDTLDLDINVGPEADQPVSFTSDAVLSNTGSTNPDTDRNTTDFGANTSDTYPMIHLPHEAGMGATMRFSELTPEQRLDIAINNPSAEPSIYLRGHDADQHDGPQPAERFFDSIEPSSEEVQRPVSPGLDDLMKEVIAAEKEWLSIHGEDDVHSDRGSKVADNNSGSDAGFDTCDADSLADILAEVAELPDVLVTSEFCSLRDTWLNRRQPLQRSLSMSELELIEPRDRYEGISLSADCLITMDLQATKTMSSDSITYVFMSRPISCDMLDLETWSPPHRRRSVPGFKRGTSVTERVNRRIIEEERSVSAECLSNKFMESNGKYLSYSADASRFIQPPDPFLGREGDIFGPQDDDDTDYEGEPTNFFAVSYDSNRSLPDTRSDLQTPNSLFEEASVSLDSDSVFESTGHLASSYGVENLTTVGISSENVSSDMFENDQASVGADKDRVKKAVSWGHISEKCIEDRPFVSVSPKLQLLPGSPEESELNLHVKTSASKPEVEHKGRRRSRSLSPSHAEQIDNQLNKSNLAPTESTSQTGESLEKVNRAVEDEAIRQNHNETTQLLQEAIQTIHKGMGTQTDDLSTASVNMQTDSPQPDPRDVSLGFRSDFSESRSSVGASIEALGPTDSGVFDGQSTGASMANRRPSPSRSSTERPLMLAHSHVNNEQGADDNSFISDSIRTSSRSLAEDYYRYMAVNQSANDSMSQRTIETQTYPQVRYIETQTALQMRYIETQTEDEVMSVTNNSMLDYVNVSDAKREEPLKIVVDTGVSPSPPLSPKEFGSQTDTSLFRRTTETAIQTDPDVAVIRASSPKPTGMVAVGMQAGTPHLSAAEMTASSEDEDSVVIHSRSRSRSRQREIPGIQGLADSSDEEDVVKSEKTERSRSRKKPVFSEIRGVLGSSTVPTGVPSSPSTSPRSVASGLSGAGASDAQKSDSLSNNLPDSKVISTANDKNDNGISRNEIQSHFNKDTRSEITVLDEEDELEQNSAEMPEVNLSASSLTPFRASQNLIEKVRHQVNKLDQMDDYESTETVTDTPDYTVVKPSSQLSSGRTSTDMITERLSLSSSPEPSQSSADNSRSTVESVLTSEAGSLLSGGTPSSESSKMTVITDDISDQLDDQSDVLPDVSGSQEYTVRNVSKQTAETEEVLAHETLEDQAVYISKLGDVVIDSSVPISDADADKLRAAVQAGDEDLLAKTIEEINQSLSKPAAVSNVSHNTSESAVNGVGHQPTRISSGVGSVRVTSRDEPGRLPSKEKAPSGTYKVTIPSTEKTAFKHLASDRSRSPYTSSPALGGQPQDLDRLGLSPVPSLEETRNGQSEWQARSNGLLTVEPVTENITLHESVDADDKLERPRSGAALSSTITHPKPPLVNGLDVIARSPTNVMGPNETELTVLRPRSRSASTQWEDTGDRNDSSHLTNGCLSPTSKDGRSPNTSMKDEASETDFNDKLYDKELEQLRRERQRILDMLAKDMMPSKLQVELAEAQLNYIIGQTDTLLSTLDEPSVWDSDWLMQLGAPEAQLSEISQQHVARYRETLEASRQEIERRIYDLERDRDRTNRSRDRSRAMEMMKRDAQLQAFKLEREREQITYERTKLRSPRSRSDSPDHRRASLGSHSPIPPTRLSPASTLHSSYTSLGPSHSTPLQSHGPPVGSHGQHGSPIPDPPSYSSVMSQRGSQGSSSYVSRSSRRDSQGSPAGSMFSSSSSFTSPDSLPTHMTPKQRKEHLIGLRKNLLSSSGEMRSRSESPAATANAKSKPLPRSYSPMFSYSTFSSPPSTVPSPKKKRPLVASANYSLLSTSYPATDELHRETEERLRVKVYHGRQRDGSMSDTASISSLISSLDDDSIQLLNEYQEVRGQADQEIIKAKETLQKKPSKSGKKTPTNYLQRRLELESLKQQVGQSHEQDPTKDQDELEKSRQRPQAGSPAKEEIDSEIERLKLKYGSIGNNSTDASSRSSLLDKSPDGSTEYPPGGRTSTPQQDIQDTLRRYQSGSDTSATKGSALDASTWDSYLDSSLNKRTETTRSSYLPSTRNSGSSYGRYTSPYSSSSSYSSAYSYRSYSSPYTSRSDVSSRRPLHFTEPRSRAFLSKR